MRISLFLFLILCCAAFSWAQTDSTESLTISTYFPSPYGVYRQLEIHRSVKFEPLDLLNNPPTNPAPQSGELAYNNDQKFYYHNGTAWKTLAGGSGGGSTIILSCPWHTDYTDAMTYGGTEDGTHCGANGLNGNCCTPPACPAGWTSVITYPRPVSVACGAEGGGDRCFWSINSYAHPLTNGQVARVCVKDESAVSSGTLFTVSCPWHSDGNNYNDIGSGDGTHCGSDGLSCCTPPVCPAGWTSKVTYPELVDSSCSLGNCDWCKSGECGGPNNHPAAAGRVVRVCEKN